MQISAFRKNVMRTISPRAVKQALRVSTKDTVRVNSSHAAISLKAHTGALLAIMAPYVLGEKLNQGLKDEAAIAIGDMGADIAVLAKVLKVKLPSATKKTKLSGTLTASLLEMDRLSLGLLEVAKSSLFDAPPMTKVKKMVTNPAKGGAKEERDVDVLNSEAEKANETTRREELRGLLVLMIDHLWRFTFGLLGVPPAAAFDAKFARLQAAFPGVSFETAPKVKTAAAATPPTPTLVPAKGKKSKKAETAPATA